MRSLFCIFLLSLFTVGGSWADDSIKTGKMRIAIGGFTFGMMGQSKILDKNNSRAFQESMRSALRSRFFNTNKFEIYERDGLEKLVEELQLQHDTGLFDPEKTAEWGILKGADWFIMGTITHFGIEEKKTLVGVGFGRQTKSLMITVEMRVVDVATGENIAIREIKHKVNLGTSMDLGFLRDPNISKSLGSSANTVMRSSSGGTSRNELSALNDLIDYVSHESVKQTVLLAYPIAVIKTTPNMVYLNYGCSVLENGQVLEVYSNGDELKDPSTGESLGFTPKYLGRVQIKSCREKFSEANILEGSPESFEKEKGTYCREMPKQAAGKKKKKGSLRLFGKKKK
ncbi:MAG: CsgG/HfaB family protein [Acidobacteriota bacterium]|nr:CsgG/HfaB family protein [Acidobacteriota bacterium]